MFNQFNTLQAVKLLQSDYDGSAVNYHSRQRARKYLSSLRRSLKKFKDKNPDSICALHLQKMIGYYQDIENL